MTGSKWMANWMMINPGLQRMNEYKWQSTDYTHPLTHLYFVQAIVIVKLRPTSYYQSGPSMARFLNSFFVSYSIKLNVCIFVHPSTLFLLCVLQVASHSLYCNTQKIKTNCNYWLTQDDYIYGQN